MIQFRQIDAVLHKADASSRREPILQKVQKSKVEFFWRECFVLDIFYSDAFWEFILKVDCRLSRKRNRQQRKWLLYLRRLGRQCRFGVTSFFRYFVLTWQGRLVKKLDWQQTRQLRHGSSLSKLECGCLLTPLWNVCWDAGESTSGSRRKLSPTARGMWRAQHLMG